MQRVYAKKGSGVIELPFMVDGEGRIYRAEVSQTGIINPQTLPGDAPCIFNKKSSSNMNTNRFAPAVNLTETPTGNLGSARKEQPAVAGTRRPLRVILDNTTATEQVVVVGDGYGLFATKNGIPAKDAGVIVGGTYGTLTLDRLADIPKSAPFDLHGYHILNTTSAGASSEGFLSGGQVTQFLISPDVQVVKEIEIPIADEVEQTAQKDNIRSNRNYRFQLMGLTGWKFTIPAGEKVVFTIREFRAVGIAKDMVLLDRIGC